MGHEFWADPKIQAAQRQIVKSPINIKPGQKPVPTGRSRVSFEGIKPQNVAKKYLIPDGAADASVSGNGFVKFSAK